jgi:hypothetical protein
MPRPEGHPNPIAYDANFRDQLVRNLRSSLNQDEIAPHPLSETIRTEREFNDPENFGELATLWAMEHLGRESLYEVVMKIFEFAAKNKINIFDTTGRVIGEINGAQDLIHGDPHVSVQIEFEGQHYYYGISDDYTKLVDFLAEPKARASQTRTVLGKKLLMLIVDKVNEMSWLTFTPNRQLDPTREDTDTTIKAEAVVKPDESVGLATLMEYAYDCANLDRKGWPGIPPSLIYPLVYKLKQHSQIVPRVREEEAFTKALEQEIQTLNASLDEIAHSGYEVPFLKASIIDDRYGLPENLVISCIETTLDRQQGQGRPIDTHRRFNSARRMKNIFSTFLTRLAEIKAASKCEISEFTYSK